MVTRLPLLASRALRNPRVCVRICALSDFSGVFPIVSGAVLPACWAGRILSGRRAFVSTALVKALVCFGYAVDVNRICLGVLAAHHNYTLAVVIVRESFVGVVITWMSED